MSTPDAAMTHKVWTKCKIVMGSDAFYCFRHSVKPALNLAQITGVLIS